MPSSNELADSINPRLAGLCQKLAAKFDRTPLAALGEKLIAGVVDCALGATSGTEALLLTQLQSYLDGFPDIYGARFFFDAAFVRAIAAEIGTYGALLPANTIVPLYGRSWSHTTINLFVERQPAAEPTFPPAVELVWFPGTDRLDNVDLLAYPWLVHELAHPIIEIHGSRYLADTARSFEAVATARQLRAINDSVAAKERHRAQLSTLRDWWLPSGRRANWMIELAADVLAFWLCGPAYLSAMKTVLDDSRVDFFRLTAEHPPYELRTLALVQTARHLGWSEQASILERTLDRRQSTDPSATRNNRYLAVADRGLTKACTARALELCEELRLPRCQPTAATRSAADYLHIFGDSPDLGLGLIMAAQVLSQRLSSPEFEAWQERTVAHLADLYTPEQTPTP